MVKDTGVGMTKEQLEQATESISATEKREQPLEQGEGRGLGLDLCLKICEQIGGFITLSSEIGKGTIAQFVFNAKSAKAT